MARAPASLLLMAAMMAEMMAPTAAATAACNCTSGVVGAVVGTFFGTLLLGLAILLILWLCCLRQRFERNRSLDSAYEIPENPAPVSHDMHGHTHRDSLWGVPSALKKYLKKCSLPPESVHQIKLDSNPSGDTLDFSIASQGVGLFLKDIDPKSNLGHIRHLEEGAHLLGLSVAFDSWTSEAAAEFLSRAAPFRPQLHVRCAPQFAVEGLLAVPVCSAAPARVPEAAAFPEPQPALTAKVVVEPQEEEEELVFAERARGEMSAPPLLYDSRSSSAVNLHFEQDKARRRKSSKGFESVELSEEHPAELRLSGTLTYDRSDDVQPERILIARMSVEVSSDGSRTVTPRDSSAASPADFALPPGYDPGADVYRATPLHLGPDDDMSEFDMEVPCAPLDFADFRPASPLDSGFGTGAFANNGAGSSNGAGGLSSSEASQDALPRLAYVPPSMSGSPSEASQDALPGLAYVMSGSPSDASKNALPGLAYGPPSMSGSSSPASVREEQIEQAVNPRAQLAPRSRADPHHPELSELDRKIALNNIEIATLMLNDSHNRLAHREARFSESEPESAHEDHISPTPREQLFPRSGAKKNGFENAAFEGELTLNGDAETGAKVNCGFTSEETFA